MEITTNKSWTMRNARIIILLLSSICFMNCSKSVHLQSSNNLNFSNWKEMILKDYDTLIMLNQSTFKRYKNVNSNVIRNDINGLNELWLTKVFESTKSKNRIKDWRKLYLIFNHFEGEVNFDLFTLVFYSEDKSWGVTYKYFDEKHYETHKVNESVIQNFQSKAMIIGGNYMLISQIDRANNILYNKLLIGVPISEIKPMIEIINKKAF